MRFNCSHYQLTIKKSAIYWPFQSTIYKDFRPKNCLEEVQKKMVDQLEKTLERFKAGNEFIKVISICFPLQLLL